MGVHGQLYICIEAKFRSGGKQCSSRQPTLRIEGRSGGKGKLFPTKRFKVMGILLTYLKLGSEESSPFLGYVKFLVFYCS